VHEIRKYKFEDTACSDVLFVVHRYHYKFVGLAGDRNRTGDNSEYPFESILSKFRRICLKKGILCLRVTFFALLDIKINYFIGILLAFVSDFLYLNFQILLTNKKN